ncbi:uncharacterized protein TNCV_2801951 [Trichonephila clavipes]|nr:uncharacterized protein TNCV_2801951 [Trichonephila clavipes]
MIKKFEATKSLIICPGRGLEKDGTAQPIRNSAPFRTALYLHQQQEINYSSCSSLVESEQPDWSYVREKRVWLRSAWRQTIVTRFRSGHLRTLTSKNGSKALPICIRCSACQASSEHILNCLGFTKQDLYEYPLMVLDFLRVSEIMDLV